MGKRDSAAFHGNLGSILNFRLDHPNVMKLGDFWEDKPNKMFWMVLELMGGGELFDRLQDRWDSDEGYPEREAMATSKSLLEAVAYIHKRGIVHRDLKLENILYSNPDLDAVLKLSDFGFAVRSNGLALDQTQKR